MRPVIEPVRQGERGPRVTNLHLGLLSLIHNQSYSTHDQQTLLERIAPEVAQNLYGEVTRSDVGIYQYQLQHWPKLDTWPPLPTDEDFKKIVQSIPANCPGAPVDEGMARALNWLVETFRRIECPPPLPDDLQPAAILQALQTLQKGPSV